MGRGLCGKTQSLTQERNERRLKDRVPRFPEEMEWHTITTTVSAERERSTDTGKQLKRKSIDKPHTCDEQQKTRWIKDTEEKPVGGGGCRKRRNEKRSSDVQIVVPRRKRPSPHQNQTNRSGRPGLIWAAARSPHARPPPSTASAKLGKTLATRIR